MADLRRWLTALAVPLLFVGIASAQVGSGGGTQLTCSVNTSNTPQLRSEGETELVGDIVITCTGGTINVNNGTGGTSNPLAPAANITISLTTQVTSRLVSSTTGASEATLLIDEPHSGLASPVPGFGPSEPFTPCAYPSAAGPTGGGCAGPTSFAPSYVLTQTGTGGSYQTAVTSSTATQATAVAAPNVYQGIVSGNQVTFYGVPIVAPGTNGSRVFRITNIRVNASGIGGGTASGSLPVQASVITSNPSALPISNPTPIVGFVTASLSASVGPSSSFGQCNSASFSTGNTQATVVTFKELFATAFKTRVDPTVSGQSGGQGSNLVQNVPGTIYNSESGFMPYPSTLSTTPAVGLADAGTRFTAVFNNIPAGIHIYVSLWGVSTNPLTGAVTGQVTTGNSTAELVTSETAADTTGAPVATATTGLPTLGAPVSVVDITPSSGTTATATWETITNQPTALDTYQFAVFITFTASPGTNSPAAPSTPTVNLRYGPASTSTTQTSGPIPRFLDTSKASNTFGIGVCRTVLLFPFITNQAGFDTGIAVANTSTDPFGTSPQTGTCSLNFYGAAQPTTAPSIGPVASGTAATFLASVGVPGFQGYMIAICNFQYAHGFAFISDLGARNLAMGYLALVIPDPNLQAPTGRNPGNAVVTGPAGGEQLDN